MADVLKRTSRDSDGENTELLPGASSPVQALRRAARRPYLWMRLVRGSISFFPRRGSKGVRAPNCKPGEAVTPDHVMTHRQTDADVTVQGDGRQASISLQAL